MTQKQNNLPQIPKGWTWTKVGDITEINPKLPKDNIPYDMEVSFLPMKAVEARTGKFDLSLIRKYSEVRKGYTPFADGDIIFAKITPCMENGKIAIVNNLKNGIGFGSTEFHVVRLIENDGSKEYVFHYLLQEHFRRQARRHMKGTAGQLRVPRRFLEDALIPLPPFSEQYRIVGKVEELFTRLDAGVESLRRIKAQLRRYRQAVLKHAFKGKLTEEWRKSHKDEIEPASMLPKHIKEDREKTTKGKYIELPRIDTSDLPELPESWVWTRLEDIILLSTERFNPIISENERFVGLKNIESNTGRLLGFGKSSETRSAKTRFRTGDLLYGRLRPYLNKVWVADFEGVCSTDILVFLKNDFVDNNYLSMVLLNSDFVKYTIQRMTGVQHPRISFRSLSKYVVPLPSLHEQHVIAEEIKRNFSVSDKVERVAEQSLIQSERLRQGILKRAFEGRLVPQDPTDEPAEKLLKRIREWREKRNAEEKKIKLGKTSKQEQLGVSHYVK